MEPEHAVEIESAAGAVHELINTQTKPHIYASIEGPYFVERF